MTNTKDSLTRKIKVLNESIWEQRAGEVAIQQWLSNFTGASGVCSSDDEQIYGLYLLSRFTYFGSKETRELLRALYRDLFRQPLIQKIRRANADTTDLSILVPQFQDSLNNTRFIGVGNPSESGTHLLYYFRQENELRKELFKNPYELFTWTSGAPGCFPLATRKLPPTGSLAEPQVRRYIFIDDFCGSGQQAAAYLSTLVAQLKALDPMVSVEYLLLAATQRGLDALRAISGIDNVAAVLELDESFKAFSSMSRYFAPASPSFDAASAEAICRHYGQSLLPGHPLGYQNCQLLLAFHHNTPDNTLPIFWYDEDSPLWHPIFRRYPKID